MQFFASKKVYMFFYGVIGIIKVMNAVNHPTLFLLFVLAGNAIYLLVSNAVHAGEEVWYQI